MGGRERIEVAFNHWQQCDFHRHIALVYLFDNVVKVVISSILRCGHVVVLSQKPLSRLVDPRMVDLLPIQAKADSLPYIIRLLISDLRWYWSGQHRRWGRRRVSE